jgi:succinate dehydrogenase / fumarate reductase iron-sulfur subunit
MRIHLRVWRQAGPQAAGSFQLYTAENISANMSFLEMLDVVNDQLITKGAEPIAFDSDCREGICGTCGFLVDGRPHGPDLARRLPTAHAALQGRRHDHARALAGQGVSIVRDLVVDRSAFDRIIQAGGYTSVNTGGAPDANAIPIAKPVPKPAFDSAQCIGCGACVAACKNASAALFTSAKITHLALLPQGQVERSTRVIDMVERMDAEGFGACSNEGECEAVCPKGISLNNIATMNREFLRALLRNG